MLLALDTSLGVAVAVVDRDRGILAELSVAAGAGLDRAAVIGELIAEALVRSGAEPASLSGVAVGTGPGSGAAIDVGIAAARGFAAALGKPVVRVLAHDALVLDRAGSAVVVTEVGDGMLAWTPYGERDPELGLPVRLAEPAFVNSLEEVDAAGLFGSERLQAGAVSAGAVGMLAERLFAGKRSFARREPYRWPPHAEEG
jgi:tRNA A37 threonylcarbamoyladenosine modification protein TsaB